MPQGKPMPGELYRHFKNKMYQIQGVAYHSETMERYVVYQALYGDFKTYIRPYDMFNSEVDREKYPDVTQKYRFEYLGNVADAKAPEDFLERQAQEKAQVSLTESAQIQPEEELQIDPWLDKVLDAQSTEEKYGVICQIGETINHKLIDDIAVIMDLTIQDGPLEDRYEQLKYCVRTKQRYEMGRR